ncbi:MAG: helix-turn-helix transcriptional regulator [Bacteroidetes bacterium]|nr:helix-turn-helix transcriptional regulator [Bacteroidota bacterium]
MKVIYKEKGFELLVKKIAQSLGSSSSDGELIIPPESGTGTINAYQLQDDISVMIMNCTFHEDLVLQREPNLNQQYFILHFFDISFEEGHHAAPVFYLQHQTLLNHIIFLSNSSFISKIHIPAGIKINSVSVLFHKNIIHQFISPAVFEKFTSNYYYRELHGEQVEFVDSTYRAIIEEIIGEHKKNPVTIQFIYNRILLLLERMLVNFHEKLKTGIVVAKIKGDEVNAMIQAESELVKNFSEPAITIASLSKMAGMSPTKFKKQFRNFYGMPVYEYFQKYRMLQAKNILKKGGHSIMEVGKLIGYSNLGHFAAAFKKEFGILPKDWAHNEHKLDHLK